MNQVGCVYTAKGFEFDYVGVIWGRDLVFSPEEQIWKGNPVFSHDTVCKARRCEVRGLCEEHLSRPANRAA